MNVFVLLKYIEEALTTLLYIPSSKQEVRQR